MPNDMDDNLVPRPAYDERRWRQTPDARPPLADICRPGA
jgi:hypothetical protein